MGYDLTNKQGEYFRLNIWGWGWMINRGKDHGWIPAPTVLYEQELINEDLPGERWVDTDRVRTDWDGFYRSNDGQWVTAESATAWADALERSLSEPEDDEGDYDLIRDFIAYLRKGTFQIW